MTASAQLTPDRKSYQLADRQVGSWAGRHLGSWVDSCTACGHAVMQVGRKLGRQLRGGRRAGRYVRRKQLAAGRWTGRQVGRQTMGSGRQVGSQAGVQLGRLTYRWAHRLASSRPKAGSRS